VTSNIGETVRNDLLVHEYRHRFSFATGQLRRLLHSAGSQLTCSWTCAADLPRPILAFIRLVPASLPKCGNQPD